MSEDRKSWEQYILTRFDGYFNLANLKASLIIPSNAVLLGVALSGFSGLIANSGPQPQSITVRIMVSISIGLLLLSSGCALSVVFSFLKPGSRNLDYHSLIFFGSIRKVQRETFIERFDNASESDLSHDALEQIRLLSDALHKKFVWQNAAVVTTGLGIAFLSIAALVACWR